MAAEVRSAAGSVTRSVVTATTPCQEEPQSGTSASARVGLALVKCASGIVWCIAHSSSEVRLPWATSAASAAKAPAAAGAAAALARDTHAQRAGHDLEAHGRRTDLFPVELDRERLGCVHLDDAGADEIDFRVREMRSAVQLRSRAREVELVDVADQEDVE